MGRSLKRALLHVPSIGALALGLALSQHSGAAYAATAAGTVIVNSASATYQDGNSNTYTTNSNTVSTTVQNVPTLTVAPGTGTTYAPGAQVSDTFTLTNTGNNSGTFTVTGVTLPGSASGAATYYIGATAYADLASLQTYLSANPVAAGGSVTIGVKYTVSTSATSGTALPTILAATITLPAAGTAPAATTATPVSGTENDSVIGEARLDLQKTGLQPGAGGNPSGTNIYYAIAANNGGGLPAKDLTSVKTLLGVANPGIFISDLIPTFGGTPLTINNVAVVTSAANGYTGTTAQIYTSTNGSAWTLYSGSGNAPAGSKYVGVYITGGTNGNELASHAGSSAGSVAAPAVTLSFQAIPPTGNGSGNANAVLNEAVGVVGGNQGAPGVVGNNVIGPGIAANTADSLAAITTAGQGINYPVPASPQAAPATTSGASQTVGNSALATTGVLNGPLNNPGASGSYNGVVANNTSNDFTAVSFNAASFVPTNSGTVVGTPIGNTLTATTTVTVSSTYQNTGNATANVQIAVTPPAAPAGWSAQIYAADASGVPTGPALGATTTFSNVAAGASGNYAVVYTAPVGTQAFVSNDAVVTATIGAQTNTTHHELVLGGPIYLTKVQTLDPTTCPGGFAVPGCKITYTVNYQNNAAPAASCATPLTGVATALAGFLNKAGTFVITEDGTAAPSTWAVNTNGLTAPATDNTSNTYTTNTAGSSKFTSTVGGATGVLNPGCSGAITFSVVIK